MLAFAAATVAWAILLWSGSRGAPAGLAGAVALLWVLRIDPAWKKCVAVVATAAVLGAGLSLLIPRVTPSHGIERILRHSGVRGEIPKNVATLNFLTNGRARVWSRVAPQAMEHPWFGHGPDGYLHSGARGTGTEQPHNLVLQFIFEWGFVGAAAMLALLFLLLRKMLRRVRWLGRRTDPDPDRAARLGALTALFAIAIHSLVDGSLHHAFPLALAAVSLAICAQPAAGTPLPSREGSPRAAYRVAVGVLAGIVLLNTWVMMALSHQELPEPDATRVRIVRAFPSRVEAVDQGWSVFYWATHWLKSDPKRAIDWLHFGHFHARQPWRFYQLEGRILLRMGDREAARWHFEEAIDQAGTREQREASQQFLERLNAGPAH